MPLPVTISSAQFPSHNYYLGPFKAPNGAFYAVFVDTASGTLSQVEVHKATDPTTSWSSVATHDGSSPTIVSLWAWLNGTDIQILLEKDSVSRVHRYVFSTSSDTFTTSFEEVVGSSSSQEVLDYAVSVAMRSDGDIILGYQSVRDTIKGTKYRRYSYARREGSSWTVALAVAANTGETHYDGGVVVLGASDRVHFFFSNHTNGITQHRSLSSGNSLDTIANIDTSVASLQKKHAPGVSYSSGGATKVRVPYVDSSGQLSMVKLDSGADPTITTDVNFSDNTVGIVNGSPVACTAIDGTTIHELYSDSGTSDLYRDQNADGGGWGTDVEVLDAVTINRVSANVYDRSGAKLAYVYDDLGTVKYNEVALVVGQLFEKTLNLTRTPVTATVKGGRKIPALTRTATTSVVKNISKTLSITRTAVTGVVNIAEIVVSLARTAVTELTESYVASIALNLIRTPVSTVVKVVEKVFSYTRTPASAVILAVGKVFAVTRAGTTAVTNSIEKIISLTRIINTGITPSYTARVTLAITRTAVTSLVRVTEKSLVVSMVAITDVVKIVEKVVGFTRVTVTNVRNEVGRVLDVVKVGITSITTRAAFNITLSVTRAGATSIVTQFISGSVKVISYIIPYWRRRSRR